MTILKKDVTEEGKIFYTFIDENFKPSKSGKGVIVRGAFYFPASFVKNSKNTQYKFINVSQDKLLEGLIVSQDKVEDATTVNKEVKTIETATEEPKKENVVGK
jgi:hypothetical protein